jgi:hypothetical protein
MDRRRPYSGSAAGPRRQGSAVQRVARDEHQVAGLHPPDGVADAEVHLAIQHDHDLVVAGLGVQGVAGVLDDGEVGGQELPVAQKTGA